MPMSDKKKCQSLINACAAAAEQLDAAATRLDALRARFLGDGIDPAGTPLEGSLGAVGTWIRDVRQVADAPVARALLAAAVPTHRGTSLET